MLSCVDGIVLWLRSVSAIDSVAVWALRLGIFKLKLPCVAWYKASFKFLDTNLRVLLPADFTITWKILASL